LHDVRTDPSHSHGLQRFCALNGYRSRQDTTIITASVATERNEWVAHAFFDGCLAVAGHRSSAAAASTALHVKTRWMTGVKRPSESKNAVGVQRQKRTNCLVTKIQPKEYERSSVTSQRAAMVSALRDEERAAY